MRTHSRSHRHQSDSTEHTSPKAQPTSWSTSDTSAIPNYDFSHVDLFSHAPQRGQVQMKLSVGAPNDMYEQEADRVAEQVLSMPDAATQPVQRQEEAAEDELQMKSAIQRQESEEDELQMKPLAATITPLVQREAMPEDEELQAKLIQRQESEEEELQTKPIQRQESEEEELQTKLIQREVVPEEEEPLQAKSSTPHSPLPNLLSKPNSTTAKVAVAPYLQKFAPSWNPGLVPTLARCESTQAATQFR